MFPGLYIEIRSNKYFIFILLPYWLQNYMCMENVETFATLNISFLPSQKLTCLGISIALAPPQENNFMQFYNNKIIIKKCNFNHILVPLFHYMVYNNARSGGDFS